MVNSPQWGYDEMSKRNGIFFKSSINPFPPVDKRNIWVRGRLSSSLSYSFPPFPSSSDLCSLSSTSHTSPHFAYIRLELHPSLCLLLSTFLNPKTIPPRLPLSHDLRPPLHIHLYLCLDLHHDVCTPLHLHLCLIYFKLPHSFTLHIPLPNDGFSSSSSSYLSSSNTTSSSAYSSYFSSYSSPLFLPKSSSLSPSSKPQEPNNSMACCYNATF